MKVLHIIPSLKKGGAERLVLDICRELSIREEVEVQLAVFRNENDYSFLTHEFKVNHIPSLVVPSLLGKWKTDVASLTSFIKKFNPDIIHSHLFEAEIVSRLELHRAIYVSHLHDNMPPMRNFSGRTLLDKKRFTDFYEKCFLIKQYRKCNNNFIAISSDTEHYFKEVLPADLHQISVLHNAIDYQRFFYPVKRRVHSTPVKLVTAGSLVDKKNQLFLIDIAKELVSREIDFTIDILGDGPNRNKIEQAIIKSHLEHRIFLHGNVNEVETYFHKSDIYIHPAYYEPFGLVLLEAMAAGLPVVTLDGRGNRDIMQHGENGFILPEQNADLFAQTIVNLIINPAEFERISSNGQRFALDYDIAGYTTKLLEYYNSLSKATNAE